MHPIKTQLLLGSILLITLPTVAWSQHKLTLELNGMDPHVGQRFQVRVLDKATDLEVGRATVPSIPGALFSVDLYVLLADHSYWIDFYADYNQNSQYDAPPTDHAWRLELNNAQGDLTLPFTRNTTFTDIQWPLPLGAEDFTGTWTGSWTNITFGSTGPITALVEVNAENDSFRISLTTHGVFGNPDTVTFVSEGVYVENAETTQVVAPPPWSGNIILASGQISAELDVPSYGITFTLIGTMGPSQAIMIYAISGGFQANGVAVFEKQLGTGVNRQRLAIRPIKYALYQNYPNPFNSVTMIPFSVSKACRVVLKVHDVLGKTVATLVDGGLASGVYEVPFDATGLPSGVYFCRIEMENFQDVKKMTLLE